MFKNVVSVEICLFKPGVGLLHGIALRASQNAAAHKLVKKNIKKEKIQFAGKGNTKLLELTCSKLSFSP